MPEQDREERDAHDHDVDEQDVEGEAGELEVEHRRGQPVTTRSPSTVTGMAGNGLSAGPFSTSPVAAS